VGGLGIDAKEVERFQIIFIKIICGVSRMREGTPLGMR
jgi:hypothetical protein